MLQDCIRGQELLILESFLHLSHEGPSWFKRVLCTICLEGVSYGFQCLSLMREAPCKAFLLINAQIWAETSQLSDIRCAVGSNSIDCCLPRFKLERLALLRIYVGVRDG